MFSEFGSDCAQINLGIDVKVKREAAVALLQLNQSSPTSIQGQYAGWQLSLSYIQLRSLQVCLLIGFKTLYLSLFF